MDKIKCWNCGAEATKTRYVEYDGFAMIHMPVSKYSRCYCDKCAAEAEEKEKNDRALYIQLKKREMFLKACSLLEKQHTDMY